MSGGHMRYLIFLMQTAITRTKNLPITEKAVLKAIALEPDNVESWTLSFLVGWALPTTASIALVKSSINSLLTDCSLQLKYSEKTCPWPLKYRASLNKGGALFLDYFM